jgi:hypothetical protein
MVSQVGDTTVQTLRVTANRALRAALGAAAGLDGGLAGGFGGFGAAARGSLSLR